MWRVSSICMVPEAGDLDIKIPCIHFNGKRRKKLYNLTVKLVDDNGQKAILEGYEWRTAGLSKRFLDWDAFTKSIQEYDPYGYIPGATGGENFMLVAVDDASYKFLDYIERIHPVEFNSEPYKRLSSLSMSFGFVFADKMKSLVDVNPPRGGVKRAFPLFQATCFAPAGWQEDGYYMWNPQGTTLYRAEFIDVHEARSFAGKQTMAGYGNPMLKGIGVIRGNIDFLG